MSDVVTIVISTVIGAALSFMAVKLLDRLRRRDAETEAGMILERARNDASNLTKEAQLKAKSEEVSELEL